MPADRAGGRSPCPCLLPWESRCTTASTARRRSPPPSTRRYDRATRALAARGRRSASPVQARAFKTPLSKMSLRGALATKQSIFRACGGMDCFAALAMTGASLVQKIQRQAGARPVHRDQFALAGQRDVGGLQLGAAEGDVGGDAVAGRDLLDQFAIRRD